MLKFVAMAVCGITIGAQCCTTAMACGGACGNSMQMAPTCAVPAAGPSGASCPMQHADNPPLKAIPVTPEMSGMPMSQRPETYRRFSYDTPAAAAPAPAYYPARVTYGNSMMRSQGRYSDDLMFNAGRKIRGY